MLLSKQKGESKATNKFETPGPMTNERGDIIGEKTILVSMVDVNPKQKKSVVAIISRYAKTRS